jgi:hypothetical protein
MVFSKRAYYVRLTHLGFALLFSGLLALLLFLGVAAGPLEGPQGPEALGSIAGLVTDEDGAPVTGVEVTAYADRTGFGWVPMRQVKSNGAGAYLLPALRTGIYRLHFRSPITALADEYYDHVAALGAATDVLVTGAPVQGIDVRLAPAAQVTGRVTVSPDVPVDGGDIWLYGQVDANWEYITTTRIITPTGAYTFTKLLAGTYRVCGSGFLQAGFYPDYFWGCYGGPNILVAANLALTTGESIANVDMVLGEGQFDGVISGRVTMGETPLAGIKVTLYLGFDYNPFQPTTLVYTYTNAQGFYQIGGLDANSYRVGFSDPAGVYTSLYYPNQWRLSQAQVVQVPGNGVLNNIDAQLALAGTIRGQVRYSSGQPAPLTAVQLYGAVDGYWELQTPVRYTDPNGEYMFQGLPAGNYRLCMPFELPLPPPFGGYIYYPNCYGTDRFSYTDVNQAATVTVTSGVTTVIDATVGPERLYLPAVRQ